MQADHPEAIAVRLGGKERRLKLGPMAFRRAKLSHDVTISMAELQNPTFDVFALLAWVALLPDEPDLTEDTVLGWMAADDVDESVILAKVATALRRMIDGMNAAFDQKQKTNRRRTPAKK